MKTMLLTLAVTLTMSFNVSALTPKLSPAQQLTETVGEYLFPDSLSEYNLKTTGEAILDYYKLEHTPSNLQRMNTVLKDYYNSPETKARYYAQITAIYEKNMTTSEIQEWIKFFESPIGVSILKNKAYNESLNTLIEKILPEDAEPSVEAQKKMMSTMLNLVNQ